MTPPPLPPPPPSYSSATTNGSSHSPNTAPSSARARERLLRLQILLYFPFFLLAHTTYCLFGQFLVHRATTAHSHHQSELQSRSAALVNLGTIFVTALMAVISTTLGLYGTVLESVPLLSVFWVVSAITALWHLVLVVQFGFAYIAGFLFLLFSIYLSRRYRLLLAQRLHRLYQQQQNRTAAEEPSFTVVSVIPEKA